VDIAAWLRGLGLERYEEAFRENEIDAEVLLRLTADDLTSLGVTAIGHRRKLLDGHRSPAHRAPCASIRSVGRRSSGDSRPGPS
jgi:hypothetical protein